MVVNTVQEADVPHWVNNLNSEVEASRGKNQKNWFGKIIDSFSSIGNESAHTVSTTTTSTVDNQEVVNGHDTTTSSSSFSQRSKLSMLQPQGSSVKDQLAVLRKTPNEATLEAIRELEESLADSKLELAMLQSDRNSTQEKIQKIEKERICLRDEYSKTVENVTKAKKQLEEYKVSIQQLKIRNQATQQGQYRENSRMSLLKPATFMVA